MLFTKSIFKPIEDGDGIRISVMSRHTLNDGKTPNSRLDDQYDEHLKEVAPPVRLVGDYYKRGMSWEDYTIAYLEHLRRNNVAEHVRVLAERATREDLTLLCVEETADKCHRRLLAEECVRYIPALRVEHK